MAARLSVWTVYRSPLDAPGQYVARRFELTAGTLTACEAYVGDTLEAVRTVVPTDKVRLERHIADEPHIVELWV